MKIKSQKGISLLILVLIIAVLIIIVGLTTYFIVKNQNKDSKKSDNSTNVQTLNTEKTTSTDNNSTAKSNNAKPSESDFNSWNGTYRNGNKTIELYRIYDGNNNNTLYLNSDAYSCSFTLNSPDELIYKNSFPGEESFSIIIRKSNDEINIKVSSENSDDEINSISGTYKKEPLSNLSWDGLYTNDLASISLAQYSNDKLYVNITKNINYGYIGRSDIIDNSLNSNELFYSDTFFDDSYSIKITKTDTGIKIESSATDTTSESSDILNEINGLEFTKVK